MYVDFILNGQGHGEVGEIFSDMRYDPGMLRPYIEDNPNSPLRGRPCVTINTGRQRYDDRLKRYVPVYKKVAIAKLQERGIHSPVFNTSMLPRQAWIEIDKAVVKERRKRLSFFEDIAAQSSVGGIDGMATLTYEYDAMSDPGEALVDMDVLADGRTDAPLFNTASIPLPVTHSDFWYSQRRIAVARKAGKPLDTTMAEAATRRCNEMVEKTAIGIETGITYGTRSTGPDPHRGTSTVYGATNYIYRVLKTDLTTPTGSNPDAIMTDVLEMIETMTTNGYYGPYRLYLSTGYTRYINDDYFRSGSTSAVRSLRERIMEIEGIESIRRLDYLTSGYQMLLVQLDSETVTAINGLETTVVQWPSQGGMRQNFKVMTIKVVLFKAPYSGVAGIIHGTTS